MLRCLLAFVGMAAFSYGSLAAWDLHWSAVLALWVGSVILLGVFIWSTAPRPVAVEGPPQLRLVREERSNV